MPDLTTKGIGNFCQAESAKFEEFSRRKQHILGPAPATTAIGCIQIPIRSVYVLCRGKPERAGRSVDCARRSFEFEKHTDRCFIEVQMQAAEPKRGAIFLVPEARAQADRAQRPLPALGRLNRDLSLELLLVSGPALRRYGRLRRQNRPQTAARNELRRRGHLDAEPQEAPARAEIGLGRVVERILFEHAPMLCGAEALEPPDQDRQIVNAEFDFYLANRPGAA